jgi:EAL domain-containing protein (putative c-di-GMP-specific phosphodiesterase class I)/GGDEF domain-containing protein
MIYKNMSATERLSRLIMSLILIGISPLGSHLLPGAVIGWFCAVFGIVNFISATVGWCFMYSLVGLSTHTQKSSEVLVKEKNHSNDVIESITSIRRKTFIGFSVLTLLVSSLYILEGYSSAVDFGRKIEFRHLHANTNIISNNIREQMALMKDGTSPVIDQVMLDKNIGSFNEPLLIVINLSGKYLSARIGLSAINEGAVINLLEGRINAEEGMAMSPNFMDESRAFLSSHIEIIDGLEYGWMQHNISNNISITTFQPLESASIALTDVVSRLSISSLVVLWIGLWGAYGVAGFITTRVKHANEKTLIAATTDPLTGLLNERALKQAFQQLVHTKGSIELRFTLVYYRNNLQVQLDHGNDVANKVLQATADQLCRIFPAETVLGRLNDGCFLAISKGPSWASDLFWEEANKTLSVSDFAFSLEPTAITLDYPHDGDTFDTLLKHATITLQHAFTDRTWMLEFDYKFLEGSRKRSQYASQIKSALMDKEFELYFQPKVSLHNQQMVSAEALIRWNHPKDGLLKPLHFLDLIEHSNARHEYSLFVIRKTAQCLQELQRQKLDIRLSFNLSAYDINDPLIIDALRDSLRDFDIPSGYLQVELTESETSCDIESIIHALNEISEMGYSIAMDDFGTGMSSLAYCHRLPIDAIKIDSSFVLSLDECDRSKLMVKTVIEMAKIFSWDVIAEGIENYKAAHILQTLGCKYGQGYYFAQPMPFAKLCEKAQLKIT